MDWKRFDWPDVAGEPDAAWFGYLADRGWTVSPVATYALVGTRGYLRYLGWRPQQAAAIA